MYRSCVILSELGHSGSKTTLRRVGKDLELHRVFVSTYCVRTCADWWVRACIDLLTFPNNTAVKASRVV